ncbi:MAG: signaling recognition particle receptor family protein, partial [Acholeplasmataceae bacterium]|nr:signaling recognition particle receptor family protein [Acholeplasmataceae bacterium]
MGLFQKLFKRKPKDERYQLGLHKTKENLGNLKAILSASDKIDDELFDSLEDVFIQADIGVDTVIYFIEQLRDEVENKKISDPNDLAEIIVDKMFEIYLKGELVQTDLNYDENEVNVYLFVGVNGVGKTTTIGKMAKQLKDEGKKVMMVAGDTFRAGAINQLVEWGNRSDTFVFTKEAGSDPSSVIYDALVIAIKEKYDVVLCDTAGRLQTKINLMSELSKMKRVIQKTLPNAPQET